MRLNLKTIPFPPTSSRAVSEAPSELSSRLHYSPQTGPTSGQPRSPGSALRTASRLSQRGGGGGAPGTGFARGRPDLDSHARHHRQVRGEEKGGQKVASMNFGTEW